MAPFKALLLTASLSVAAHAARSEDTECPTGWLPNTFKVTRCCSGNMVIDNTTAYCCVYDMRGYKEALTNTALLYETATTTTTGDHYSEWATLEDSCIASVPYTLPATAKKAEATPTSTSATTTNSAATSETTSEATSSSGSQVSTSTSNAAMPLPTAGDIALGGAALAAALFVL
ncbi:unnamed protein product [Penicillium manginii]